jgi:acyl-CoA hydrolase
MKMTADEAVKSIKSGDHVFIHSAAAAPQLLVDAMANRHSELKDVSIYQIHTEGKAPYANLDYQDSFLVKTFFVGANTRKAVQNGNASYIPVFLSEIPYLFKRKVIPVDIALISVSPPDRHGYCSLGTSVDTTLAAVQSARMVIAQVNDQMPRTHGDGIIHVTDISIQVLGSRPIPEVFSKIVRPEVSKIATYIADLIEDGATLQMGIGDIPNAVLPQLQNHRGLGVHSEMISDGIIPLILNGTITGKNKAIDQGLVIASFVVGSQALYDFIDDNPLIQLRSCDYVNDVTTIRKNPKMTSINGAIEVDLTGQVCADSIGARIFSGVGGQVDFLRGAALSEGGKPIIAMTSTTNDGLSKIVPFLHQGAGVVTTRAHVHYIVTEYGIANLYGQSIEERIDLLINIAHPMHRESLNEARQMLFV